MRTAKHNSILLVVGTLLVLAVGVLLYVHPVAATSFSISDVGGSVGLTSTDLKTIVINVIKWILGILALVAVVLIIYGGIIWMTAAGSPEKIQKAKRIIINAVIGLVIVLLAWAIVTFVIAKILGVTGGSHTPNPAYCSTHPTDPICIGPPQVGLEIRSITTDCKDPNVGYDSDVFICSGINITFNHLLNGQSVKTAVEGAAPNLKVEQCNDQNCGSPVAVTSDSALDGIAGNSVADPQQFVDGASSSFSTDINKGAIWTARLNNTGKNVAFFHKPALFEKTTWYRVTIPKAIMDTDAETISGCRSSNNALTDLPGCVDAGDRYTWTFLTGTDVDTQQPVVTSTYPSSAYLGTTTHAQPDRNVPRTPIISIHYNKSVFNPSDVQLLPYDSASTPDPVTGLGGTTVAAVDPATYTIVPGDDGKSFIIQMVGANKLNEYTWYKVHIGGVIDMCSNLQRPDPYEFVFETNNVVPDIADEYPRNGYDKACPSTQAFIRYTVSMYDSLTSSCSVQSQPADYPTHVAGSFVMRPFFFLPNANKAFDVLDPCPGATCTNPQDYCKVYAFTGGDDLSLGTHSVGVDNRYQINEQGETLRFGTIPNGTPGAPWTGDWVRTSDHKNEAWTFKVVAAGQCVDPPVITSIQPPRGTDGQCVTVNGFNFDTNGDGQANGDDLLYDTASIGASNILNWTNTQIPATMPTGAAGSHDVSVNARFADPLGVLSSNTYPWIKEAGDAATGPCLSSLEPSSGLNGTQFTAKGKRLNAASTTKVIDFGGLTPTYLNWGDDSITGISVPAAATPATYPVSVTNDAGTSNALKFTVKTPPEGQPIVTDHQPPSCISSCLGADISATFNHEIDSNILNGFAVKPCNTDTCTSFGADLTIVVTPDASPSTTKVRIIPNPANQITAGKWYRVVVPGSIKGTENGVTGTLGGLNYRNAAGPGDNDSYSWTFKTAAVNAGGCTLGSVKVSPATYTMHAAGETRNYTAEAYTVPNSCTAAGQEVTASPTTSWNWLIDAAYVTMSHPTTAWTGVVTAVNQTVPASTNINATASYNATSRTGTGVLTIDYAYCNDDTDCQKNSCTGSTCDAVSHRCTPYIKGFSPDTGAIGTWVGVDGCYFDNYRKGICADENVGAQCDTDNDCGTGGHCTGGSAIIFNNGRRALWPNPSICPTPNALWSPTHVTAEVPNKSRATEQAVSGSVTIQRWDGKTYTTPNNPTGTFTVDPAAITPGICNVNPGAGSETSSVQIIGQNFGNVKGTSRVLFYRELEATTSAWSDSVIQSQAPQGIQNNTDDTYQYPALKYWYLNEIAVQNGTSGLWSNVANFEVKPPGCQACTDDSMCGAGKGCGTGGCCAATPNVVSVSPPNGASNVCRNSLVSATFDRSMNASSLNPYTVHFYRLVPDPRYPTELENVEVQGAHISYNDTTKSMTIDAGLLDRNTKYTVILGVANELALSGNFEQFNASNQPIDWPASLGTAQSNDVPPADPAAGAHSVLVDGDVSGQGIGYSAQNVGTETPQKRTYHVTGWVKAQVKGGFTPTNSADAGGLITRCWGSGTVYSSTNTNPACGDNNGYDLHSSVRVEGNPNGGLFGYQTPSLGTWHYVDLTVTNNTSKSIGLSIDCFARPHMQVWCDDIHVTEVSSTDVRSAEGARLQSYQWSFNTADAAGPCQVARVDVVPSTWTYTTSDPTKAQSKKSFTAVAYSDTGTPLAKVPGVLDWTWRWSSSGSVAGEMKCNAGPVGTACISDNQCNGNAGSCAPTYPTNVDTATMQAKPYEKGTGTVIAWVRPLTPNVGQTKSIRGIARISSIACDDAWMPIADSIYGYTDSAANCSAATSTGTCTDYHFNIGYCKSGGLPDLAASVVTQYTTNASSTLLKEFLFKEPSSDAKDAIGIRIYDNVEGLSAAQWYAKYAVNPRSTTPLTVDGYDAVRDGTTIYIGASNYTPHDIVHFVVGDITPKIFLISYTQGADAKVVSIFNQMVDSFFFNNNVTGDCDPQAADDAIVSNKTCLQRDLKRIATISDIANYLRSYKTTNGTYPTLDAGSYIAGLSFSTWPSWQQSLGGALQKTLPVDPINKIENCPSSQSQDGTCWSDASKTFICKGTPNASNVIAYTSKSCVGGTRPGSICTYSWQCSGGGTCTQGPQAMLFAHLEYTGPLNWIQTQCDDGDPAHMGQMCLSDAECGTGKCRLPAVSTGLCPTGSDCSCLNYSFKP